ENSNRQPQAVTYSGAQGQAYGDGVNRAVVLTDQSSINKWKNEEFERRYGPSGAGAQGQANSANENQHIVQRYTQADGTERVITSAERETAKQRIQDAMNEAPKAVSYSGAQGQAYGDGVNRSNASTDEEDIARWIKEEFNRKYGPDGAGAQGQAYGDGKNRATKALGWFADSAFNSLDDVKNILPKFAHSFLDGYTQEGWNKLTPQQRYDILSPWISGEDAGLSPRARQWEAEIRDKVEQTMEDPKARQELLEGLALLADTMGTPMGQGAIKSMQGMLSSPVMSAIITASMKKEMQKAQSDPKAMQRLMQDLSATLGSLVGMKVNQQGVWSSTGTGLQQNTGYHDKAYESAARNMMGFDMKSDQVGFSVNNKPYVLRGWTGEYGNLLGGEFGIYKGDGSEWNPVDDDRFQIKLTLKDNKGNTLLTMDQGSPKYWQYAAAHPDDIAKLLQRDGYGQQEAEKIANDVNKGNIVVQGTFVGQSGKDASFLNSMAQSVHEQGEQMSTIGGVRYVNGVPTLTLELK
ncbi:DUF4474 domain-containing protein, partial [Christensenellaceae bacterium OttesenSCG-928-K19]|nr:DUF4474 domain-containing protein [Christensenellaceae bacterium OttesenSCG-928-K19]